MKKDDCKNNESEPNKNHEKPKKIIYSYAKPQKGYLTNPKMHNYGGNHSKYYQKFPKPKTHPWTDISMRDN